MWDPRTGIEVRIKPHSARDPYHEWTAPSHTKLYAPDRNEAFIEGVGGDRFVVEVIVHPLFQWKKATHLWAVLSIDGGTLALDVCFERPVDQQAITLTHDFRSFTQVDAGSHNKCGFTFGAVDMVDDPSFHTQDEQEAELARRGKIQVILQRGRVKKRKRTKSKSASSTATDTTAVLSMPEQTTKKIAMDNGRSFYTKWVLSCPGCTCHDTVLQTLPSGNHRESDTTKTWTEAKDDAGDEIVFNFFYTDWSMSCQWYHSGNPN
ncbi:hypothetical protein LTR08_009039 [Meristemomyces frigidus]|nr:hypothetical protein LTR08_009039 [Meristemomyces frigidus]